MRHCGEGREVIRAEESEEQSKEESSNRTPRAYPPITCCANEAVSCQQCQLCSTFVHVQLQGCESGWPWVGEGQESRRGYSHVCRMNGEEKHTAAHDGDAVLCRAVRALHVLARVGGGPA